MQAERIGPSGLNNFCLAKRCVLTVNWIKSRMKRIPFTALSLLFLLSPSLLQADTYVLKNGRKLEGELLRETEEAYVIEVQLADTIKEERVIARADVLRIIEPEKGMKEFLLLREKVPAPDGLKVWQYQENIKSLDRFIRKYPTHSKIRDAIEMRDDLRDEMRQVEDGAIKIDGVLYPAVELRENAYELDARIEARKIKDLLFQRQYLAGLRAYSEFLDDYASTRVNEELVPLILEVIDRHSAQAAEWLNSHEVRVEERKKGLESMKPSDRVASTRAIQVEKEMLQRRYESEVLSRVGWVTVHPFNKDSLEHTIQQAKSETRRIETVMSRNIGDAGELYRELYRLYQQTADESVLRPKLREAQSLGIPKRYLEKLAMARRDNR